MRILVISKEAWRDEQNGGNVLSNIFAGFDAEFAQIYCTENEPNNKICKLYYQMTDRMILQSIIKKKKPGVVKRYEKYPSNAQAGVASFGSFKKFNLESIRVLRDIGWCVAKWDKEALTKFAKDFQPDIIFAPCYGSHSMIKLTKLIHSVIAKPIISYISDDFYTNCQWRFSPVYWGNHFVLRRNVRNVFKLYSLVYTMTDEQKEQCEKDFHANMKILRKNGIFSDINSKRFVNAPIRFVYAGGIYVNRWKTLLSLADAMRKINTNGVKMVLDIYTNTEIVNKAVSRLNDGVTSRIHQVISLEELKRVYKESDIALHVEAFDKKNKYLVRQSFSTKIVDCLDSGCAVMAICDEKQAGYAYLKRNDAAICVDSLEKLPEVLNDMVCRREMILEYQSKAFALGRRNHMEEKTREMLWKDFEYIQKMERYRSRTNSV